MAVNGPAVAAIGVGVLFLYAGIKGQSVLKALQNVVTGQSPTSGQSEGNVLTAPITATVTSGSGNGSVPITNPSIANPTSNNASANQALAKQLAISLGHSDWTTGTNWSDWVKLWNQESGWSITAANPTSSARGIAQNINGYGPGYEQGNASSQITWGINYIAGRYGNPTAAWEHEVANNWY